MPTPPQLSRQPSLPPSISRWRERQWRGERYWRDERNEREELEETDEPDEPDEPDERNEENRRGKREIMGTKEGRKEGSKGEKREERRDLLITTPYATRVHRVQHILRKHSRFETGAMSTTTDDKDGDGHVQDDGNGDVDADMILYRLHRQFRRKRQGERRRQSRDQRQSGSYGRNCIRNGVHRYEGRSGEIVNAIAAPENRGLVAVARGGCVVLVDVGLGSVRGKGRGRIRSHGRETTLGSGVPKPGKDVEKMVEWGEKATQLVLFSPDALTLYFTTLLTTSIHAYSLPNDFIVPISHTHSSPPTVLAISPNGDILLSASASPPTVLFQDMRVAGLAAMEFKDVDSESTVTCAAFESQDSGVGEGTRFSLGYKDGTVAVYEVDLPPLATYQTSMRDARALHLRIQTTRVGAMTEVHKAALGGVSAVAFLPGHRSRVVGVGHDGRCRLVDFEGGGKMLRTWHVSGPATCLAIGTGERLGPEGQDDGFALQQNGTAHDQDRAIEATETHIAVGTAAGKVLVFDILGILLHEIDMKAPIVSIEWVGGMSAPPTLPPQVHLIPETGPVVMSLTESASGIEDGSSQDFEQGRDVFEQAEILQQQHLIERPINPFIDAWQDPTWMPPTAFHPNVSQSASPHNHSREPKPASATKPLAHAPTHPRFPSLRNSLSKDPVVRTGRALWNFRKRSRPKPTPPAAGRSARRSRRSACCSSRRSVSTEQEFFTPPVTRFSSLREGQEVMCSGGNGEVPLRGMGGRAPVLLERDWLNESMTRLARRLGPGPAERSQAVASLGHPSRRMSVTERNGFNPAHTLEPEPQTLAPNRFTVDNDSERQAGPSSKRSKLRYISPVPTGEASSSQSLSSSLYSRAKPRIFRGHPHALDGGIDAFSPLPQSPVRNLKRSFSFDAGFQNPVALGTQQPVATRRSPVWRGGRRDELSRLHTDTEALKRQICGLREEFQMLRSVLLRAESRRRWGECVA